MKETKEQELKRLEDYWTATEPFLRKIIETEDIHVKRIAQLKAELKAELRPKLKHFEMYSKPSDRNISVTGPNADGDIYVEIQERGHSSKTLGIIRVPLDDLIRNLQRVQATAKRGKK